MQLLIRLFKCDHPNDGEVMLQGHIRSVGLKVRRKDLRDSIRRVDSDYTRRAHTIQWRVYSSDHPNSVWHIDSHHKSIRWRFIIHASIDGFSRTVTYIRCANNFAQTVLEREGVTRFGLPDRIRSNHGGENVDVWRYMIASHNNDLSCIITGSSTHNEQVERLWCDVHCSVAKVFSELFERCGILDPLNEVDIYCLHYIFLPRVNRPLEEFHESWNDHSLSTAGNLTPNQHFLKDQTIQEWALQITSYYQCVLQMFQLCQTSGCTTYTFPTTFLASWSVDCN